MKKIVFDFLKKNPQLLSCQSNIFEHPLLLENSEEQERVRSVSTRTDEFFESLDRARKPIIIGGEGGRAHCARNNRAAFERIGVEIGRVVKSRLGSSRSFPI